MSVRGRFGCVLEWKQADLGREFLVAGVAGRPSRISPYCLVFTLLGLLAIHISHRH